MWHSNNFLEFLFVSADKLKGLLNMKHELPLTYSTRLCPGDEILCNCIYVHINFNFLGLLLIMQTLILFFLAYSYRSDVNIAYNLMS